MPTPPPNRARADLEMAASAHSPAPPRPGHAEEEKDDDILLLRSTNTSSRPAPPPMPLQQQAPQHPWQPPKRRASQVNSNNPYQRPCPRPLALLLAGVGAGLCLAVRGMVWSSSSSSPPPPTVDAGAGDALQRPLPPSTAAEDEVAAAQAGVAAGSEEWGGCVPSDPIPLWPAGQVPLALGTDPEKDVPTLTAYLPSAARSSGTSAVIMPGGGYKFLSVVKEGVDYAEWLCREEGVAAYILKYRLGSDGYHHPAQLLDGKRAVRSVRSRLRPGVDDAARVGVVGSSAGGHLSATVAAHHDGGNASALDPVDRFSSRPDFAVLVYPVVSFDPSITHKGSRDNVIGPPPPGTPAASKEEKQRVATLTAYYSIEQQVLQSATPEAGASKGQGFLPTFVYHAEDDATVPYQNSVRLARALKAAGVPYAFCLFESGVHGGGLYGRREGKPVTAPGAPAPPKHKWSDLALHFLRREGILPPHDDAPAKTNDFVGGPYVCEGSVGDEGKWRV